MTAGSTGASSADVGYSGTPLARKLGIKARTCMHVDSAPQDYLNWLAPLPEGVVFEPAVSASTQLVHLFVDRRAHLESALLRARGQISSDAAIWVSWPKKASRVPTDITEDVIRDVALPLGLVDIKVCAVSDVWSGLKLMIRKELR